MERDYIQAPLQDQAIGRGIAPEREPHFEGLNNRLGNVQDLAARLVEGLRGLADGLLGENPQVPPGAALKEVDSRPCAGVVGDLFERTSHLDDQLRSSLRELDRLKRLA